jgi:hypothetical protein
MIDLGLILAAIVATAITIWSCLQANSDRQSDVRLKIGAVVVFVLCCSVYCVGCCRGVRDYKVQWYG